MKNKKLIQLLEELSNYSPKIGFSDGDDMYLTEIKSSGAKMWLMLSHDKPTKEKRKELKRRSELIRIETDQPSDPFEQEDDIVQIERDTKQTHQYSFVNQKQFESEAATDILNLPNTQYYWHRFAMWLDYRLEHSDRLNAKYEKERQKTILRPSSADILATLKSTTNDLAVKNMFEVAHHVRAAALVLEKAIKDGESSKETVTEITQKHEPHVCACKKKEVLPPPAGRYHNSL